MYDVSIIYTVAMWCLLVFSSLAFLGHLMDVRFAMKQVREGKPASKYDNDELPFMLWGMPSQFGLIQCFPHEALPYFLQPHTAILAVLWLACVLCFLVKYKIRSGKTWRALMIKTISEVMIALKESRAFFFRLRTWCLAVKPWVRLSILFIWLLCILLFANSIQSLAFLVCIGIFAYLLFEIYCAMSSCRILLRCWVIWGCLFAGIIIAGAESFANMTVPSWVSYIAFVILFTWFWVFTAGVAEYEVAKMASLIINTFATLTLLLVNILCLQLTVYAGTSLPAVLQQGANLILLPITAAGYLSALFNEAQDYWERKYGDGDFE